MSNVYNNVPVVFPLPVPDLFDFAQIARTNAGNDAKTKRTTHTQ